METTGHRPRALGSWPNAGIYSGSWSGYRVKFNVDGVEWQAETKDGIRGMAVPCTVVVNSDQTIDVSTHAGHEGT